MSPPRSRRASIDVEIARIAARQEGLVTTNQLERIGLSTSAIAKRVRAGRLHRVHRGVYAVGHGALSRAGTWLAAVLAAGEGAALSHESAAAHWNMWPRNGAVSTHVVAPRRVRSFDAVTVHSCRRLERREMCRRFGIPVTTVARTVLDLAEQCTAWQVAAAIHEAEFRNRFRVRELERLLVRYRGRQAVTTVRRALDIRAGGSQGTKSQLEDDFLARALVRGLHPEVNVAIQLSDGVLWPDFLWRSIRLIVEVDNEHHDRMRTKREDLGRDARFRAGGFEVLRAREHDFDATLDLVEVRLSA